MRKMGNLLLHLKRLSMLQNYLKNMDQMFGLSEKPNIYYQKTLHILEVQMVNLQKKQISWMFGLTLVLLMKPYYVIMMAENFRQTDTWKGLINIVDGLTRV